MPVWVTRKEILYGEGSADKVSQNDTILDYKNNNNNCLHG